jgi:hypothetical protein
MPELPANDYGDDGGEELENMIAVEVVEGSVAKKGI